MNSNDLIDLPSNARISNRSVIGRSYRVYEKYQITLPGCNNTTSVERDVLRSGVVVGILPIDIVRSEVVLIRQFRLGSHIALGKGAMIEVPAGRVELESEYDAAFRECREETGAMPQQLLALFDIMPAPALSDERMILYAALVDAAEVRTRAGCAEEQEEIETIRISFDDAAAMLSNGGCHNSTAIIALQWLVLNRGKLREIFGPSSVTAGV